MTVPNLSSKCAAYNLSFPEMTPTKKTPSVKVEVSCYCILCRKVYLKNVRAILLLIKPYFPEHNTFQLDYLYSVRQYFIDKKL